MDIHLLKLKCKYSNRSNYENENQIFFLKCFTLHVINLKSMKVSLFEISYKKKKIHHIQIFWDVHVCTQ